MSQKFTANDILAMTAQYLRENTNTSAQPYLTPTQISNNNGSDNADGNVSVPPSIVREIPDFQESEESEKSPNNHIHCLDLTKNIFFRNDFEINKRMNSIKNKRTITISILNMGEKLDFIRSLKFTPDKDLPCNGPLLEKRGSFDSWDFGSSKPTVVYNCPDVEELHQFWRITGYEDVMKHRIASIHGREDITITVIYKKTLKNSDSGRVDLF